MSLQGPFPPVLKAIIAGGSSGRFVNTGLTLAKHSALLFTSTDSVIQKVLRKGPGCSYPSRSSPYLDTTCQTTSIPCRSPLSGLQAHETPSDLE